MRNTVGDGRSLPGPAELRREQDRIPGRDTVTEGSVGTGRWGVGVFRLDW